MLTTIGAYVLIGVFFFFEGRLRQGQKAKSLAAGHYDRGSTTWIGAAFGVSVLVLLLAPLLNAVPFGSFANASLIGALGLALMAAGLAIRYWAHRTLGEFYTRTLLVQENQRVMDSGPYRWIRNPGYFGMVLLFTGAGFAVTNWLAVIVIPPIIFAAYIYRIHTEEAMLLTQFGEAYQAYMTHTWKLIPLIY